MPSRGSALQRPVQPNAILADVVGDGPMPRTEIVKRFWDYIKKNDLQDPSDRRTIRSDALLRELTGKSRFNMLQIGGIIADNVD